MNMALILILIGSYQVTAYRSVKEQTDDSPYHTSTGERTSSSGVAVSQDLLCIRCLKLHKRCNKVSTNKTLHYGDWLYIEHIGLRKVNDVMHKRHKVRFDVWVETYMDEKRFDDKFGKVKLKVWFVEESKLQEYYQSKKRRQIYVPVAYW